MKKIIYGLLASLFIFASAMDIDSDEDGAMAIDSKISEQRALAEIKKHAARWRNNSSLMKALREREIGNKNFKNALPRIFERDPFELYEDCKIIFPESLPHSLSETYMDYNLKLKYDILNLSNEERKLMSFIYDYFEAISTYDYLRFGRSDDVERLKADDDLLGKYALKRYYTAVRNIPNSSRRRMVYAIGILDNGTFIKALCALEPIYQQKLLDSPKLAKRDGLIVQVFHGQGTDNAEMSYEQQKEIIEDDLDMVKREYPDNELVKAFLVDQQERLRLQASMPDALN